MRKSIFLLILSVGIHHAHAQDSLKVLTWNVQMLPSIVKAGGKAKRAKAIVNQLKDKDFGVVVFQELFQKRSRRIIRKGLAQSFPHHTEVLNKKTFSIKTNGGVMIFSKYVIKQTHQIRYSQRTGFDKMSRKGALLAEISFREKSVQIVGTHLQAFGPQEIMYSQYQEMATKLLQPNSKTGVTQILCGDFNTTKNIPVALTGEITQEMLNRLPRYPIMLRTLDAIDGDLSGPQQFTMDRPYNDLCTTRKDYRLLIDYILIRPNGINLTAQRQVKIFRQSWSKQHQDLSDHYGLLATLHFNP